jgi:hypothetical protein
MNMTQYDKPFVADPVPDGQHIATLTKIKECMRDKVTKSPEGIYIKTGERVPAYRFVFKLKNYKHWICKSVNKTANSKGGLYKLLQQLYDSALNDVRMDKAGNAMDESYLYKKMWDLIGRDFIIEIENNPPYVNAKRIYPPDPAILAQVQAIADDINFGDQSQRQPQEPAVTLEDIDDIPF